MGLKTGEAIGPFGMRAPEPVVSRGEALKLESRRAALAIAGPDDEAGTFQHLEVLGDGRLRERGGLCELDHASFAGRQAFQDRPTGGVGKGGEGPTNGILTSHHRWVI